MKDLVAKNCIPCTVDQRPLKGEALKPLHMQLGEGWEIISEHHLEKTYTFSHFKEALNFVNIVGRIAEEEGHHPDIYLTWGKVKIQIWTHKIDGLTESDFVLAAKCETEYISHMG